MEQNEVGPRQRAQQLKKSRFGKVVSDLACKKAFFLSFVNHPSYASYYGIRDLLHSLTEVMQSNEYEEMVRCSKEKTEEESKQKQQYHQARQAFKRGKREYDNNWKTELA